MRTPMTTPRMVSSERGSKPASCCAFTYATPQCVSGAPCGAHQPYSDHPVFRQRPANDSDQFANVAVTAFRHVRSITPMTIPLFQRLRIAYNRLHGMLRGDAWFPHIPLAVALGLGGIWLLQADLGPRWQPFLENLAHAQVAI